MKWQLNDAVWLQYGSGYFRARVVAVIGDGSTALARHFAHYGIETTVGKNADSEQGSKAVKIGHYVPGWFFWKFVPNAGVSQ